MAPPALAPWVLEARIAASQHAVATSFRATTALSFNTQLILSPILRPPHALVKTAGRV